MSTTPGGIALTAEGSVEIRLSEWTAFCDCPDGLITPALGMTRRAPETIRISSRDRPRPADERCRESRHIHSKGWPAHGRD